MGGQLVRLPSRGDTLLTKKQLAVHLGRSARWVELKVRKGCRWSKRPIAMAGAGTICGWLRHGSTRADQRP